MAKTERFGILGSGVIERDDDGFITLPVIVQDSGLFAGAPPAELRIHSIGEYDDDKADKAFVAKLNRRADLPFRLGTVKIKVVGPLKEITDNDLRDIGIEPMPADEG